MVVPSAPEVARIFQVFSQEGESCSAALAKIVTKRTKFISKLHEFFVAQRQLSGTARHISTIIGGAVGVGVYGPPHEEWPEVKLAGMGGKMQHWK